MPKFEVTFVDGKSLTIEASTADEAKTRARHTRRSKVPSDTPASAPEVKIGRVTKLAE